MPKTFDGADFDIHELEEPLDVKLSTEKERITERMREDLREAIRSAKKAKKRKSLIIALASNIVLPGLGSVYIKRTFVGISILSLNLLFLLLGVSSFNLLTRSFLSMPFSPGLFLAEVPLVYVYYSSRFAVLLAWSILLTILAWIHFFYQLLTNIEEFELIA